MVAMKLSLVPYQPAFLEAFIEWRHQPLSIRFNPLRAMSNEEISKKLETDGADLSRLEKHESFSWFVAADGQVVGTVSLKNISQSMAYGEIGYGIAESHHGKGIATAGVRLMIDKIFSESRLRRLIALVHEENHASRRVLEKLGFQEEGLLREHYLINGSPVNEVLYGLLKREWVSD